MWASDSLTEVRYNPPLFCRRGRGIPCVASTRRQVHWFNLSNGRIERLCKEELQCPRLGGNEETNRLGRETALVIYKRRLASDESYWFE